MEKPKKNLVFKMYNLTTYKNDLKRKRAHYKHAIKPLSKNQITHLNQRNKQGWKKRT